MHHVKFIEATVQNYLISHGFDSLNKEIIEEVEVELASKKTFSTNKIISISEKHILTEYSAGRIIYWEYLESYEELKQRLDMN